MAIANKAMAADWLTAVAVGIAAVLPLWAAAMEHDRLEVALGRLSFLFWVTVLVCVVCVLRWRRRLWGLLTAPVVLYPVAISGALLIECVRGNCL